ncbi:MAG: cytochrome c biogenesis protein CcsA [Acidobacteria bacterium]|nr:cytochrome c biogenesis protein CcsA [Acidobacteriota bacterium]
MRILYELSVAANFIALFLFFIFAYKKSRPVIVAASSMLAAGTLMLMFFLAFQGVQYHSQPVTTPFLSYNFLALLIYLLYFLFEFRFKIPLLGTFLVPVGFFFNIVSLFSRNVQAAQMKMVSPFLLGIHTGFLMLGEALFILAFASSVMYLIQEKNLKSKRFNQLYSRLPSLGKLEEMAGLGVSAGFPLITTGLLIGFFWAAKVWGPGWYLDPKVVWSTVMWVIYAWLFYSKISDRIRGRRFAVAVIWCVLLILLSFVVSSFLPSIHTLTQSYGAK